MNLDIVDACHNVHPLNDHLLSARRHSTGKLFRDVLRAMANVGLHFCQGRGKLLSCPVDVLWLSTCMPPDCCPLSWVFGGHETPEEATAVSSGAQFHKGVDDYPLAGGIVLGLVRQNRGIAEDGLPVILGLCPKQIEQAFLAKVHVVSTRNLGILKQGRQKCHRPRRKSAAIAWGRE